MFSSGEILMVCLLALLVLGPNKLPGVLRQIMLYVNRTKAFMTDVRQGLERDLGLHGELAKVTHK
ncbi:MAG: hypothetical protein AAGA27_00365 [Pseudomonadota bacterium]